MWTTLFPIWARVAIIVGALGAVFGLGFAKGVTDEGQKKDLNIAADQHAFDVRIKTSDDALLAANGRAAVASQGAGTDQAEITAAYEKGKTDGTSAAATRIADFTAGRQRMRVDAICPRTDAGGSRAVSGSSSAASGTDAATGTSDVELRPDAAGRVEAAAAEVKRLAQQLIAVQALAQSEHDRCNAGNNMPPIVDERVTKRSTFKLGLPNPFEK